MYSLLGFAFLEINSYLSKKKKLYELVVRHFLACISQPAVGAETTVEIDIAGESFSSSGRVIIAVSSLSHFKSSLAV